MRILSPLVVARQVEEEIRRLRKKAARIRTRRQLLDAHLLGVEQRIEELEKKLETFAERRVAS